MPTARYATLNVNSGAAGQVITAFVPKDSTEKDLAKVTSSAIGVVKKLTGCNCLSGRVRFVVEDMFADTIRVEL
jgi:hypothetical protein